MVVVPFLSSPYMKKVAAKYDQVKPRKERERGSVFTFLWARVVRMAGSVEDGLLQKFGHSACPLS